MSYRGPQRRSSPQEERALQTPRRAEVIERLEREGMLPAITFIFSRAACDEAVRQCLMTGMRLTIAEERDAIRAIAESRTSSLTDDDLEVLGYREWLAGLEAGFAAHHAGMVPPFKETVEACFESGLVKAVFATETLALGINMPARTVVIEKLSKWTGEKHEFLTPGEYTQLTGRAGRRGIDEVGYAVVLWSPFVPFDQVAGLASTRTYALTSSFRPTYNMAVNLVRRYTPESAHHLLNLSFAQYRADRDVVRLERQVERSRALMETARTEATCELGDVEEYRRRLEKAGDGGSSRRGGGAPSAAGRGGRGAGEDKAGRRAAAVGGEVGGTGGGAVHGPAAGVGGAAGGDHARPPLPHPVGPRLHVAAPDGGPPRPAHAFRPPKRRLPTGGGPGAGQGQGPAPDRRGRGPPRPPVGGHLGGGAPGGRLSRRAPSPAVRWSGRSGWRRTCADWSGGSRAAPSRWPASSTGSCGCSKCGATSTGGPSPTPAAA